MKAPGKYNLLFIHDDGATRSFRISRRAIRVLVCFLVLVPLLGTGGIWIGWQAWERQAVWDQEERILQQELTGLRLQLDRLSHIEKLVQLHENGSPVEASSASGEGKAGDPQPSVVATASQAAEQQPEGQSPDSATPPETGTGTEGPSAAPETPAQATGTPPAGEDKVEYPVVDTGQVRLADVSVLLVDGRRLRVRMDLHNESGRQVSGRLLLFLLTPDGERSELVHNDPTFRISRLKKFASTSVVPESVADLTNTMLMVEVVDSSSTLLSRQLYPIAE